MLGFEPYERTSYGYLMRAKINSRWGLVIVALTAKV
jgi:hypothetical protein